MIKKLLPALLLLACPAWGDVVCSGTANTCGTGGVTSPVATDPLTFTGVVTFNNAANTAVTLSDGATGPDIVGTTSSCGGGALAGANSVCLTANTITGEGATADAFETMFAFGDATADQTLTCTGAAASFDCVVASPPVPANLATAGNGISFTASPAIANAGAGTDGAAAGGSITVTTGAAARDTSGNANGGNLNIVTGAGIGTGTAGQVVFPVGAAAAPSITFNGDTDNGFYYPSTDGISLSLGGIERMKFTTGFGPVGMRLSVPICFGAVGSPTSCFGTGGANIITTVDATTGNSDIRIGTGLLTAATMTAEATALTKTVTSSYTWTNAQVVALGAALTGDITVATLPAKTQVLDAAVVILTAAGGVTTLTVSCGDAIAGTPFINYIVASDAKAAANTFYGDAVAERGTSIDTEFYYLPSYTATTLVTCHFISTGTNLNTVTTSTGRVILTTRLLP